MISNRFAHPLPSALMLLGFALPLAVSRPAAAYDCELSETQKVLNNTPSDGDWFGFSTAIDGDLAVVGELDGDGSFVDIGTVSTYRYDAQHGDWDFLGRIEAPDSSAGDHFGYAVDLDGDLLVVGAPHRDLFGVGVDTGAVYIFRFNGTDFGFEQELMLSPADATASDRFGYDVAISGDRIAVGCVGDDDRADDAGTTYIYVYDAVHGWTQETKLLPTSLMADDVYGWSVALNGQYLAVGSPGDDFGAGGEGSVYVYEVLNDTWYFREFVTAADGGESDNFGIDVAIDADGTLLAGAYRNDEAANGAGAAYVYRRTNTTTWTLEQKLLASDAVTSAGLGYRVALEGDVAVVAAWTDNNGASPQSGSVYSYVFDGALWTEHAKIGASDNLAGNRFGGAVDLDDGLAFVGCYYSNDGAVDAGSAYFARVSCSGPFGDMNCDGVVDLGDVGPFALALVDPAMYAAQYAGCDALNGDATGDSVLNGEDVAGFVAALLGG